jgi:1-deoxy-D-xylulose-5-phosphate synthase
MPTDGLLESPRNLAECTLSELTELCGAIRRVIIDTTAQNGGHLSSNLGVVELSVALHSVFSSPRDKIVWDVGHQCYAHKLLTGRAARFHTLRQEDGIAGFPRREESVHDAFDTGHASTSISAALGLLTGEALLGGDGRAVAVIGDGALTGGLAYEALSNAGHLELPVIIILNDNKMSISPNVGALSRHLSLLSMKGKYQTFRRTFDAAVRSIPLAGAALYRMVNRLKRAVKAVFYQENFFVDLGFEYVGPVDGHDIKLLRAILQDVRRLARPVVVHVITRKGKGYPPAEEDPGGFHSVPPFSAAAGTLPSSGETWTRIFGAALAKAGGAMPKLVAITAAMEKGTGLAPFKAAFPRRFFDVGIAEAHAVTFAAALAAKGLRPVVALYSTFLQRAVDSVIHDTALGNLPVLFALDRAGFVSGDGETHQGLFDISLLRAVPNMTLLAPADSGELALMLDWALAASGPSALRYPKAEAPPPCRAFAAPLCPGRGVLLPAKEGGAAALCIAFTGSLFPQAQEAARLLAEKGVCADLYNLRFLKPVDEAFLLELAGGYSLFVVAEEGARPGGFGEYLAALVRSASGARPALLTLAAGDLFYRQGSREELLRRAGLDGEGIARAVLARFGA